MFYRTGSSLKILIGALALTAVTGLTLPIGAQEKPEHPNRPETAAKPHPAPSKLDFAHYQARGNGSMPMILDWSNRHVIYTAGYTDQRADKMAKDPRAFASFLAHGLERRRHEPTGHHPDSKPGTLQRDWAVSLGAGRTWYGVYPAKYSFDVNAPPSCANDFVVFPISGSPLTGSSRAKVGGTFTGDPMIGQTVSITITPAGLSPVTLALTAGTTNSGTTFALSGTNNSSTDATNLAAAINRNLSSVALDEVAAATFAGTLTVYGLTAGTGVTLTVSNSLSNFSWGSVTAGVTGSQANIIGLNNLYAGSGSPYCAGDTYPTFTFSYSAGASQVDTSPALSLDGRKIAFIENDGQGGLGAILHVLSLGTGTEHGSCTNSGTAAPTCATAAVTPGSTPGSNASDYMLPLELAGGLSTAYDYYSSPFVDYFNDVLYVGDQGGNLFSVSPVFGSGTPALRTGFPVVVAPSGLSSPVVDLGNTGNIFVGTDTGRLYNVTNGGVVEGFVTVGFNGVTLDASPVVDSTNGVGYIVADCNAPAGSSPVVVQFSTTATGSPGVLATAALSATTCPTGLPIYAAIPDNNYYTKGISSSTPGNNGELLVAYDSEPNGSLAQLQFTSGTMNTTAKYTDTDSGGFSNGSYFSPLTEFYGNDQAYPIGTVTQTGSTVTVTTTVNLFVSNQVVVLSGVAAGTGDCTGAAASAIDGEQTVTVTSPTTFTFTSTGNTTIGGVSGSCTLTSALATGPTQDYLFFSLTIPKMFTFNLPLTAATQPPAATNTTSVGTGGPIGGECGIVVDNDSSNGQASSIYFSASGLAIKLTQAGLN